MANKAAREMNGNLKLAVIGILVVGCGGGLGGLLISSQQEVEIGQGVHAEIGYEYRMAEPADPVTVWAGQLVTPLVEASRDFRNPDEIGGYKVAVIAEDELLNAFAAPGGFTYLSTGLILQARSCAEIAGVMGHELGHVTERHSVKKLEEAFGLAVIAEWFLGEGLASDVVQNIYGFLQATEFSQEAEAESDSVGLQIAYEAGYNPYGLVDFFEKLLELTGGQAPPQFLSSHPATADRITDVSDEIQRRYGDAVVRGTTQTYGCIGTQMTLAQVQAHIASGAVAVVPGTGEGPPAAAAQPPAE